MLPASPGVRPGVPALEKAALLEDIQESPDMDRLLTIISISPPRPWASVAASIAPWLARIRFPALTVNLPPSPVEWALTARPLLLRLPAPEIRMDSLAAILIFPALPAPVLWETTKAPLARDSQSRARSISPALLLLSVEASIRLSLLMLRFGVWMLILPP